MGNSFLSPQWSDIAMCLYGNENIKTKIGVDFPQRISIFHKDSICKLRNINKANIFIKLTSWNRNFKVHHVHWQLVMLKHHVHCHTMNPMNVKTDEVFEYPKTSDQKLVIFFPPFPRFTPIVLFSYPWVCLMAQQWKHNNLPRSNADICYLVNIFTVVKHSGYHTQGLNTISNCGAMVRYHNANFQLICPTKKDTRCTWLKQRHLEHWQISDNGIPVSWLNKKKEENC